MNIFYYEKENEKKIARDNNKKKTFEQITFFSGSWFLWLVKV